jgi:hypothetical protein
MRFHKSKMVSAVDARALIQASASSLNANIVISHNENWYDVRSMTQRELDDFVSDLLRANIAAVQAGLLFPH